MEIKFENKKFEKVETEFAHETKLPPDVIKSAQKKLQFLRATKDEKTLMNWKSLHYKTLSGNKKGLRSIRLNDKWRMIFKIEIEEDNLKALIVSIEDYH